MVSSDYSFFSGCSYLVTIDPVLTESNNDLILIVETPILHFAGLKFSSRLRELTNHNHDYLCRQILNLEYPPKIPSQKNTCQIFLPPSPPPPKKKKIWNRKFQTQKILQSSLSLEIWSSIPHLGLSSIMLSLYEKHKSKPPRYIQSLTHISLYVTAYFSIEILVRGC